MKITSIDRADAASGILFLLFGLFFGSQSLGLELGTAFRMGPGFFPLILSGVLMCFGLLVLFNAFKRFSKEYSPTERAAMFHDTAAKAYRISYD